MEDDPNTDTTGGMICSFIKFYWKGFFMMIWPLLCASVFTFGTEPKFRCIFVLVLMAGYWVTEVIPLPVTGLMPMVLVPIFNIQKTAEICLSYMNLTNAIFMASMFIATGIEYVGLHKRIAFGTLFMMGCQPRKLHFGFIFVTMILSMWLINAATTAMMCPIILAILLELEANGIGNVYKINSKGEEEPSDFTVALYLSAAYSATLGGTGSLVGTGTNLTFKGLFETRFKDGVTIEFVAWLLFNVPPMLVLGLVCYISLEFVYMGLCRPQSEVNIMIQKGNENADKANAVIKERLKELGKMSWGESMVLFLFICVILLWFFRNPQFMPGWNQLFTVIVADATPAIGVVLLFSIIPGTLSCFDFCTLDKSARPEKITPFLVPWSVLSSKMPWGLIFLLGGGFALASAGQASGMSKYLGDKLSVMKGTNKYIIMAVTSMVASLATELTSNVAICNIILPTLLDLSVAVEVHPILFSFPVAVMCSFSFLLPTGTPSNAIVQGFIKISTPEMIKGGAILKFFSWLIYMVTFPTYGSLFYDISEFPTWVTQAPQT